MQVPDFLPRARARELLLLLLWEPEKLQEQMFLSRLLVWGRSELESSRKGQVPSRLYSRVGAQPSAAPLRSAPMRASPAQKEARRGPPWTLPATPKASRLAFPATRRKMPVALLRQPERPQRERSRLEALPMPAGPRSGEKRA